MTRNPLTELQSMFRHLPRGLDAKQARELDAFICDKAGKFIRDNKPTLIKALSQVWRESHVRALHPAIEAR